MPESNLITQWGSYFLKGNFRLVRNTFNLAGQDSFTDPPAQNTDLFSQLVNIQPPVHGDLNRRWGYGAQTIGALTNLAALAEPAVVSLYQNSVTDTRQIVYMTGDNPIVATTEAGQVTNPNIFTPIGPNPTRMLSARSYGYFADGTRADYQKWDGQTTTTIWGIDINNVTGLTSGPLAPTIATDLGASGTTGQTGPLIAGTGTDGGLFYPWTTPGNITAIDGNYAKVVLPATINNSGLLDNGNNLLKASNFHFNIPVAATITGVTARILRKNGGVFPQDFYTADLSVKLLKASVEVGTNKALVPSWGSSLVYASYGASTDLWGTTLTPADVNASGFGLGLRVQSKDPTNGDSATPLVDDIELTVYYTNPSVATWSNVNNIKVADGILATTPVTTSPTSELQATNFGFALPASNTILGIQVDILSETSANTPNLQPILTKAGVAYGVRKSTAIPQTSLSYTTFGGPSDLWGGQWTPADVNASDFGVQFFLTTPAGSATASVDFVRVTVYAGIGPILLGAPIAGSITLTVGRIYTLVFKNSITGHLSNNTPFSLTTGPLTNQNQPITGLPISADPQVDKKILLATADGGDETTLYFVAEIANSDATYTDSTPESTLLLQNIYADQDATGNTLGIFDNTPPPLGSQFPINHRGRVYMATANNLYYSKAESDLVTASGTLTGKYEEAWPPLNYFALASEAEAITGLLSDGQVLYIGTNVRVLRLYGDGPASFQEPEALFKHTGVINQDVWKMVFLQGNPLGAMWLTPDYRVLGSDFNTYQDLGQPIQNILDSINTQAAANVAWSSYVGISNWNLFVLAIPTGTNTQPDTLLIFDLRGKQWYVWKPTDTMLGGLYNISIAGQTQFISVANTGAIWNWGPQFVQDQVGVSPTSFPVTIESSWQDFTDAAARKYLNEIEIITDDPTMAVSIDGASTKALFDAPNVVVANQALRQKPLGEYFVSLAPYVTKDRYYRYRLTSTDSSLSLLRGINIQGGVINRL